jgi:hypothetical protein
VRCGQDYRSDKNKERWSYRTGILLSRSMMINFCEGGTAQAPQALKLPYRSVRPELTTRCVYNAEGLPFFLAFDGFPSCIFTYVSLSLAKVGGKAQHSYW